MRKRSEAIPPPPPPPPESSASVDAEKRPPPPPLFASANKGPGISPDYERIVERVYSVNALEDYEDIEKSLHVGEQRGDRATLLKALDEAETKSRIAHRLFLGARLEKVRYEVDADAVMGAIRQKATDLLEDEKADGTRKKAITEADVTSKMVELHRDEVLHQRERKEKISGTVLHLEKLADLWQSRCRSLATMISNLR